MSISGSMLVAGGAMDTYGNTIAVAGDNIANFNTVGFKASRFTLEDLFPTVDGSIEVGDGVRLADVSKPFRQGAFETTSNVTDLAIGGNGYFVVRNDATNALYYTRAGQFHVDNAGRLVNESDLILQGSAGDITVGTSPTVPAQATTSIALELNLDAGAAPPPVSFPAGPDASASDWVSASNFSSLATIYDSLGSTHDLTFLYRHVAPNTWEYRVAAARSELDATAPNSNELREVSAPGTLVFTPAGQLDSSLSTLTDISGLNWVNGASQTIAAGSLSFAGTVQYAQPTFLSSISQDGFAQGSLVSLSIDPQGLITGRFSNGINQGLGAIVLANFANVDDLNPIGDTLFAPTLKSGAALTGVPDQNGLGSIVSGALELSTVELTDQFVSLITSQRSFQANSRVVTTADQMYAIAAELKPL
jgi:flagellar hook protein FlgE